VKLAIVGAGAVGQSVLELAGEYRHEVVGVADSRSAAVASVDGGVGAEHDGGGLDAGAVLERKAKRGVVGDRDPEAVFETEYEVLVEATPTTLGDAEPGFSHVEQALAADRDVVLANKGPVAQRYGDVRRLDRESAGRVRYEATVAGAIPVLGTIADYGPEHVEAVRGILNGTANFVLSRMATEGLAYEHVLAEAQDLGVAEADPSFDVDGTDAALKCVILANVLAEGHRDDASAESPAAFDERPPESAENPSAFESFTLADATVEGITSIPPSALELASEDGRTIRLVGEATPSGARVGPRLVPKTSTLAVDGTRNVVQLETATAGELELGGRGAGGDATASAVLADIERLTGRSR
jgi:homoserine dehydrogenase